MKRSLRKMGFMQTCTAVNEMVPGVRAGVRAGVVPGVRAGVRAGVRK
jgi:hypothetical protein